MKGTYKIIKCPYCGAVVAKIRKVGNGASMDVGAIMITGDGVYCGRCGKKLPEDIARELGVVTNGEETIFGLGFTSISTGLDEE